MIDSLQKTFRDNFTKQLIDGVKAEATIGQYIDGSFEIPQEQLRVISGIYQPVGLQQRMMDAARGQGPHCVEAAIELFKAYKDLSPLIASSESFWAYLCHTELNEFVRMDGTIENRKNRRNYILRYYFFGNGYRRNALAGLWWGVYLSYDEEREKRGEDPFALTRLLFKSYSLYVRYLAVILRIKNALHGILEYLYLHPEVTELAFGYRARFIAKYFNMLGATKQLSSLPKSFFVDELEKLTPVILSIKGNNDITNKEASAIIQAAQLDDIEE